MEETNTTKGMTQKEAYFVCIILTIFALTMTAFISHKIGYDQGVQSIKHAEGRSEKITSFAHFAASSIEDDLHKRWPHVDMTCAGDWKLGISSTSPLFDFSRHINTVKNYTVVYNIMLGYVCP
jgi:mannose/fructose/N-acetylgalactosamine-specific phosphotransferase system component IID